MAKQPKMINEVIGLLGEGRSSKEIQEIVGCSKATVSIAKKRLAEREEDINTATADINEDVDENVDSFIKEITIKPDEEVINDDDGKTEDQEYQCPKCDHEWSAAKNEHQSECPGCGMEFE